MNKTELAKSKKPYVYIQFLDKRPVWVGSGVGYRAWVTWEKPYHDRRSDVEVHIVCVCETREEAFDKEEIITQMYKDAGVKLSNEQVGKRLSDHQKKKLWLT